MIQKYTRKQKQEIKIREQFSFLLDEIKETENRVKEQNSKYNNAMQESITIINKQIKENQKILLDLIQIILVRIEKLETSISSKQKNIESIVNDNTKNIVLNIDEVKSLMQLLAVNDLLDEINV